MRGEKPHFSSTKSDGRSIKIRAFLAVNTRKIKIVESLLTQLKTAENYRNSKISRIFDFRTCDSEPDKLNKRGLFRLCDGHERNTNPQDGRNPVRDDWIAP